MVMSSYSLSFRRQNVPLCWRWAERVCENNNNTRYALNIIHSENKTIYLKERKVTSGNNPKSKFLTTAFKIVKIFLSLIFIGIPFIVEKIVLKVAETTRNKFRKIYKVNEYIITRKVTDIENNLSFNTLKLMYLMLNHINNKDPSNVNKLTNSSVIIDFLVKNVNTFKNFKKLQKPGVDVTLDSISILSKFLPNLEMIDFSNASYLDFANEEVLDLTKFKNLKTLKLNFKKEFPKLTPSNFKLDGVKGLTIDLIGIYKLNTLAVLKFFINPMIFKNCKNVTILISPLENHLGNQATEDEIHQIYHQILKISDSVTFKIVEKK